MISSCKLLSFILIFAMLYSVNITFISSLQVNRQNRLFCVAIKIIIINCYLMPLRKTFAKRPITRRAISWGQSESSLQNRKVTDYFPIRRSNRKTNAELKSEQHKHLDDLIKNDIEEGMEVKNIDGKGRGVFAVSGFKRGDFVVEYHGDLLDLAEAKIREAQYAEDPQTGCYMYYFQYQSKTYCVDATKETSRLGRLVNHCKTGNCQTRLHPIDGTPHLILVASRDINAGEELLYDYGDRSKASILAHPWLKH
uniref:[histone H4]-lysine(20) N-methyltransferase n=1 Tax=Pundamilia nyererei TaxID=303518 RepID=A0A3B4GAK2_9CICH